MRFSGQGMMSHTATTTISRYFTKSRGKALSTGWFGLSTAEFILPVSNDLFFVYYRLEKYLDNNFNYYINFFTFNFFYFSKKILILIQEKKQKRTLIMMNNFKQWKRVEVVKDYRFYIVCANMLAMPSIATGTFVYQSFILIFKKLGALCNSTIFYVLLNTVCRCINFFRLFNR